MTYKSLIFSFLAAGAILWGCAKEDDGSAEARDLPLISAADLTITEGDANQKITVTLAISGNHQTNAVLRFAAVSRTADATIDYEVLTSGQIVFAPGETQKNIEINIVGDEVKEPKETFEIKLYNPINVNLAKEVITVTIEDDDDNSAGLVIPSGGYATPTSYPGMTLVWADEFNGTSLDLNSWTFETGTGNNGWGNNELQYYREDNTSLVGGHLVITAKQQQFGGRQYTSSRIVTKGKKNFKFGRIDIRAALPEGQGLWPALWMLGSNIDAVSWPACGEIDIMELTGNLPNRVVGTVHYGANVSQHQYISQSKYLSGNDNFQDEFHVFSINWVADKIEFLVDDEVYHTITPANLNGAAYPFNKPFFFIFNVAVGGNWPGSPDATTAFPQHMIVDYVRVFQ
ncbi:MAG TPA: family 16 glycosylhydrolase [Saprospiraceae bacterium]|nr:family 16 glycosylhydrolase [Saprospiraceae bacterium]